MAQSAPACFFHATAIAMPSSSPGGGGGGGGNGGSSGSGGSDGRGGGGGVGQGSQLQGQSQSAESTQGSAAGGRHCAYCLPGLRWQLEPASMQHLVSKQLPYVAAHGGGLGGGGGVGGRSGERTSSRQKASSDAIVVVGNCRSSAHLRRLDDTFTCRHVCWRLQVHAAEAATLRDRPVGGGAHHETAGAEAVVVQGPV